MDGRETIGWDGTKKVIEDQDGRKKRERVLGGGRGSVGK
jgi:hypothetical protein